LRTFYHELTLSISTNYWEKSCYYSLWAS